MDDTARQRIADQQTALVAALVRGDDPPGSFDPDGVRRTSDALIRKRWAAVQRHWPMLAAGLAASNGSSTRAAEVFHTWATRHKSESGLPAGGFGDGLLFALWLRGRRELPVLGRGELAAALLRHRPQGEPPKVVARRRPRRLTRVGGVIALRTPAGVRLVVLPPNR